MPGDKEIKLQIQTALSALNKALQAAGQAGLTVKIGRVDITMMGNRTPVDMWTLDSLTRVTTETI